MGQKLYKVRNTTGATIRARIALYSEHRLHSLLRCRWFVFYPFYLYLFTHFRVQHDCHTRWCSCRVTLPRRASIVEQELPPSRSSCTYPIGFSEFHITQLLVFCVVFLEYCLSFFFFFFCIDCTSVIFDVFLEKHKQSVSCEMLRA